jgi:hypothetical protein
MMTQHLLEELLQSTQILMSGGTKDPNIPEAVDTIDDKSKPVNPSAIAAVAGKTSYKTSKLEGSRSNQPELAGEIIKKNNVTKAAVRQPKGECDPEWPTLLLTKESIRGTPRPATYASHGQQQEGPIGVHQEPLHSGLGPSTPAKDSTGQSALGHQ